MSATRRPTDGQVSRTVTAVSGSQASSSTPSFPGQGHPLVSGPQSMKDWQFYFDTLAPGLSAKLDDLGTYLGVSTDKLDTIRKEYPTQQHEICFHLLWTWYKNSTTSGKNDGEKLKNLHQALEDVGLHILTHEDIPSRGNYQFTGEVISGTTSFKDDREILKVAKRTLTASARLGRYFGLEEEDIQRVVSDNNSETVKQARGIIKACVDRNLLQTRQDLCNGLNYIQDTKMIDEMKKTWSC
ncbi:uncharacterized protein LOC117343620 [Pecten maximus]|uniref:uncharacterized protein LOC117343620 n=1 Tax=Pecten maximus TaxID=6579 RepID=UPI001458B835|nr:uncharacterized protein LOC117343620 [Pecten maximus]XP_033761948.1 uncharacterized protein LOC117343620 [Pecten maximus]